MTSSIIFLDKYLECATIFAEMLKQSGSLIHDNYSLLFYNYKFLFPNIKKKILLQISNNE